MMAIMWRQSAIVLIVLWSQIGAFAAPTLKTSAAITEIGIEMETETETVTETVGIKTNTGDTTSAIENDYTDENLALYKTMIRRSIVTGNSQPIYELQVIVWPIDMEPNTKPTTTKPPSRPTSTPMITSTPTSTPTTTTTATSITDSDVMVPLYEDQLIVFPQMDSIPEDISVVVPIPEPPTTSPVHAEVVNVVQDYRFVHPNGTSEYKLALSNGLVVYKRIYTKNMHGKMVNVQEGYESVPVPDRLPHQYQTQYYIADENGYNVYKIEHSYRKPELPDYLHYKAKVKNVSTSTPTPKYG